MRYHDHPKTCRAAVVDLLREAARTMRSGRLPDIDKASGESVAAFVDTFEAAADSLDGDEAFTRRLSTGHVVSVTIPGEGTVHNSECMVVAIETEAALKDLAEAASVLTRSAREALAGTRHAGGDA